MSFPYINAYQQFFDSSGSPLASGTIEFRDPTSNNLINSYSTADLADAQSTANDNPLTLSATGAATAGLFLEDDVKYKVILKDSLGATVATHDDVRCPGRVNGLLYTQGDTGSVARTLESKLQDTISVFDFMTAAEVTDVKTYAGLVDVTAAVNSGLVALDTIGMTLWCPAGKYRITSQLTEPTVAYWGITGDGPATFFDVSEVGAGNSWMAVKKRGARISYLEIAGDKANDPNFTVHGLEIGDGTGVSHVTIDHIRIINCSKGLVLNSADDGDGYHTIEFFENDIDLSIEGTNNSSQRFYNCSFLGGEQCVDLGATTAITNFLFDGCTFAAKPFSSARIPLNFNYAISALFFRGCRFEHRDTNSLTDHWDSINLSGLSGSSPINSLVMIGNYFTGDIINGINIADFCIDAVIVGNYFNVEPTNADIKIGAVSAHDTIAYGNTFLGTRTTKNIIYDLNTTGNLTRILSRFPTTLADDGTPTVREKTVFRIGGTTAITDFDDGYNGQTIEIRTAHTVTITHNNAIIALAGAANYDMVAGDTLTLTMFTDQIWTEVSRSTVA